MKKCVVAVCGVLGCIHNECGRCYNGVIALDKGGSCLCFERKKVEISMNPAPSAPETIPVNAKDIIDGLDMYGDFALED